LRERRTANLDAMMNDAIEVEVNLMESLNIKQRFNGGGKKPQGDAHSSTSRPLEDKFNLMMKTMEKLMERMFVGNNFVTQEKHDLHPINQNLRTCPVP
jgi:hypothetical protein